MNLLRLWTLATQETKRESTFVPVEELADILEDVRTAMYNRHAGFINNRATTAIERADAVPDLIQCLIENNVSKIRLLGHGDNAVIIVTPDERVFRLRGGKTNHPGTWEPPDIDQVIYPFYEAEIRGCRVTGTIKAPTLSQKVMSKEISVETANRIIETLEIGVIHQSAKSVFWDVSNGAGKKFEQIGFLPDNTPIIIDTGSVMLFNNLIKYLEGDPNQKKWNERVERLSQMDVSPIPEIGWDGRWLTADGQRKTILVNREFLASTHGRPSRRTNLHNLADARHG